MTMCVDKLSVCFFEFLTVHLSIVNNKPFTNKLILLLSIYQSAPFHHPVNSADFPDYRRFISHPMDLETLAKVVCIYFFSPVIVVVNSHALIFVHFDRKSKTISIAHSWLSIMISNGLRTIALYTMEVYCLMLRFLC